MKLYNCFTITLLSIWQFNCSFYDSSRELEEPVTHILHVTLHEELRLHDDGFFFHEHRFMAMPLGMEESELYNIELPETFVAEHRELLNSGELYIEAMVAEILDGEVIIAPETAVSVSAQELPKRFSDEEENRTVAVLRISMESGERVSYSAADIEYQMFERPGVNLVTQYDRCSNRRIRFQPLGVFDVLVPGRVSDYSSASDLRNAALRTYCAENPCPGPLRNQFADHVIAILPENDFDGFVGNAGINYWISTLNNHWSLDVRVYLHELGHNLGLGHAFYTQGGIDMSSIMGATGWEPVLDGPLKCFNGASNRILGWWSERTESVNIQAGSGQMLTLAALSDAYGSNQQDPVIVEIGKYTLHYNLASNFNSGTEALRDMVTVSHRDDGVGTYIDNNGLSPRGTIFRVNNFDAGQTLRIQACERVDGGGSNPAAMKVAVTLGVAGSPCDNVDEVSDPNPPRCEAFPNRRGCRQNGCLWTRRTCLQPSDSSCGLLSRRACRRTPACEYSNAQARCSAH